MAKWETAPQRAWNDTKDWLLNHILAWFLAFIVPGGGTVLAAWLIPPTMDFKLAALYGFLGGIAGLLLLMVGTYVIQLVLALKKQRDEARDEVVRCNQQLEKFKEVSEAKLEIKVGEANIEPTGIVIVNIALRPSKKMQLDKIALECGSKMVDGSIQGNVQLPHFIESGVNYNVEFQFFENVNDAGVWEIGEQMLIAHGQRRREAKLRIIADAIKWVSTTFPIPTKIQEPEFILQYDVSIVGELLLEKDQRGYKMTLPLVLWFKNRDERNPIWIEKFARVGFDTILKDGNKEPYQLQNQDGGTIYLGPGEDKKIEYELVTWNFYVEPVLGDTVHCHWDEIGNANMSEYGRTPLKLLEPFDVKVHKTTPPSISHKEGSQT